MSDSDDQWAVLHCSAEFADVVIEKIRRRLPGAEVNRLMRRVGYLAWRWDPASWDDVRNAGGVTGYVGSPNEPTLYRLAELEGLE